MTELINQSMSKEADCRTAPATPGRLNIPQHIPCSFQEVLAFIIPHGGFGEC